MISGWAIFLFSFFPLWLRPPGHIHAELLLLLKRPNFLFCPQEFVALFPRAIFIFFFLGSSCSPLFSVLVHQRNYCWKVGRVLCGKREFGNTRQRRAELELIPRFTRRSSRHMHVE